MYESLDKVLAEARMRASHGKGKERHSDDKPFDKQAMMKIMDMVGNGFATGQAIKKIHEATNMDWERGRLELLDAIVYLAGAVVWGDRKT